MTNDNPYAAPKTAPGMGSAELYQPKVFSFSGRIGRLRYLGYGAGIQLLLIMIIAPIVGGVAFLGGETGISAIDEIIIGIFYIATFVVSVMFSKRRLNDLNRSGWWYLLFFIPIVNLIFSIYLIFFPGTDGSNKFGTVPLANSWGVIVLASIVPIFFFGGGILAAIAIPQYADYTQRTKVAGAIGAALSWKTAILRCAQEQGELATCGNPGVNGVPSNVGADKIKYVTSISTTGAGVITIISTGVSNGNEALEIILTPSWNASSINWTMAGNGCTAPGRSIRC
jgi:uncharacterized membrane protein YhaH (DUF805 family)/Tfp pilus assembly major pilin PilA